ncbi:undecaprenyldiphospho-muramoylpentapeptide beta-N-acetylglucosaminyltransferase [Brevibacterium sp. 5221]|uniref:UDP-N-acetylglucosamine--N-acetylmuramyl-(pentapeptide) pyrophosphoryl-undecaprenol N-acetylglucosamine transferase n=1 Tax=Brevibacterium rongguiense TaxID=2695267 RepID=A0A6N9H8H3_9MICO|nr:MULTISPECIES: undecaprenyldiphospho-muramoylpentapeptide beta-N-acetylglucosaminyltransferase [Brevibacterium]MYM20340.1 undecaprenyldiphospho-muramoylpentapeptide beta-N-acetylglucosaminyltransferase [Brevibacterium rongguiense]WAL41083.1 undecaprenyldiphospho-muramoylpentapeptide beta-N-acetylglucosaminyltransferase [Brevibacterium sp. BRM-1]
MLTVLLAGGGTTGHISPLLAIADDLAFQDPEARLIVLGTEDGLESRLVPAAGYELVTIDKVPAPRRVDAAALAFPRRLMGTVTAVRRLLKERAVDVVVGVGGYVASPAYLAARSLGIPIVIHEANARPGLANRLGARLSRPELIGYTFANTPLPGTQVGMPMRAEVAHRDRRDPRVRAAAAKSLGLDPAKTTLVVTGGSLGAAALNRALAASVPALADAGVQVLHITGAGKAEEVVAAAAASPDYHVVEYVDGMEDAYTAADLIVCRAGAGTVAEVTTMQVPAVYVPLPIGNGEQRLNAADAVAAGAALLVDDADFTPDYAAQTVLPLLRDPARLAAMAQAAADMGFPRSADRAMAARVFAAAGAAHPGRAYPERMQTKEELAGAAGADGSGADR